MSELSQFDDGNVLTHGSGMANRKKRGRRPLDYPDEKNKVSAMVYKHRCLDSDKISGPNCYEQWHSTVRLILGQLSQGQH